MHAHWSRCWINPNIRHIAPSTFIIRRLLNGKPKSRNFASCISYMKRLSGASLTFYPLKTEQIFDVMNSMPLTQKMLGDISCKSFPLNNIYEVRGFIYEHYPVRSNPYLSNSYFVSKAKRKLNEARKADALVREWRVDLPSWIEVLAQQPIPELDVHSKCAACNHFIRFV